MDIIKEHLRIKNGYTNSNERISFSVQVVNCSDNCESKEKVAQVMKQVYFTLYTVQERINFGKGDKNYGQKPTSVIDTFQSQFMLDVDKYIDNNNFLRYNEATTFDYRYSAYRIPKVYQFFDLTANPVWTGEKISGVYNTTKDFKTYEDVS